mmetsp:Transcript_13722/g.30394  ORF Transcript_13722/g.30394 Transcript_13722/m.30394 type:complete len:116 (-) Transcript_13722:800-1147(-)
MVERRCATIICVPVRARISGVTELSVAESREDVASSDSRTLGFLNRVRAIPTRCFSPPLSFSPLSPTIVSSPWGNRAIVSVRDAARTTSCTSSSLASGLPYRMLYPKVSLNSTIS